VTRRRAAIAAGAVAAVAFLATSALVARWLHADNVERAIVHRLLVAQARGDADGMARELSGCAAPCRRTLERLAARLGRGPDAEVEIVRYDSQTARALGARTGPTRVVWRRPPDLPTVQCVTVRRTGSALVGIDVRVERIGPPIARRAGC
jgi:hypothetical protein